jgi:uncharacterized protein
MADYLFPESRILVFAKAPILGQVKTRMQPVLSEQQSLDLHRRMLRHCLRQACHSAVAPVELWVSAEHEYWQGLSEQFEFKQCLQRGNDLGQRMANALQQGLSGQQSRLVIGSDCPFIDIGYLEKAFTDLADVPVVLGPALDGGYVLLGLRQFDMALFEDIPWGSEEVLARTLEQLAAIGWSGATLASLADIDRPEDLQQLHDYYPQLYPFEA